MALRMEKFTGGGWNAVDLVAERCCKFRFALAYSHPARLMFTVRQPQHTAPIPAYTGIRFWDDAANDAGGNPFSAANPLFLGFTEGVQPKGSNEIEYTCYDSTARAASLIQVFSTEWEDALTVDETAVPRLIFNGAIDNDDDYTFCRGFNLTVGQMISIILDDAQLPLEDVFASGAEPYEASDLLGMNFVPQEKIVFTSEPIRSAVMRLVDDWAPQWRMLFYPGSRKWRFGNIGASPSVVYTLNDFSGDHPILKLTMDRSLENRSTAVRIYGPEAVENTTVTLSDGGLISMTPIVGGPTLDTYGAGAAVLGQHSWRIVDEDKRRMGRLLAETIDAPSEEFRIGPNAWTQFSVKTRSPTLFVKYKFNNAGTDAWQAVAGVWNYDHETGILTFGDNYLYRFNPYPQVEDGILQPNYENPEDVMLIYPSALIPLQIRVPETGYEGTAFTQYNLQSEEGRYDPSLAVGYLFGVPVTSATKIAKFLVYAQAILDTKKNVIYHGGMTLEGIDYTFHLLDRMVNIAGVDHDGAPVVTGWEGINAIVTDVEYDFEERTTTVNFSSDHSELLGFDPEKIKQALKVDAGYISQIVNVWYQFGYHRAQTEWGTPYLAQSLTVGGSITPVAVDPYFGTVEGLIS